MSLRKPSIVASAKALADKEKPAISEQMEIVYDWWKEIDQKGMLEVHVDKVTELLVRKTIT